MVRPMTLVSRATCRGLCLRGSGGPGTGHRGGRDRWARCGGRRGPAALRASRIGCSGRLRWRGTLIARARLPTTRSGMSGAWWRAGITLYRSCRTGRAALPPRFRPPAARPARTRRRRQRTDRRLARGSQALAAWIPALQPAPDRLRRAMPPVIAVPVTPALRREQEEHGLTAQHHGRLFIGEHQPLTHQRRRRHRLGRVRRIVWLGRRRRDHAAVQAKQCDYRQRRKTPCRHVRFPQRGSMSAPPVRPPVRPLVRPLVRHLRRPPASPQRIPFDFGTMLPPAA
jgi:hypothetical protein